MPELENGPLVLKWSRNDDGTYNIRAIPIFQTHKRFDEVFDEERLDTIVENSTKRRRAANAKVFVAHNGFLGGDSKTQNVGLLRNLARHFGVITADFLELRPAVFREIHKKAYVQRSVELDPTDLDAIEGIALLGKEQPYFPFRDIGLELSEADEVRLDMDVDNDTSFQWSRGKKVEHALYALGESLVPKFYVKRNGKLVEFKKSGLQLFDKEGNPVKYEVTPEDMDAIDSRLDEKLAPVVESIGILSTEVKAMKESAAAEEETEETMFNRQEGDVPGGDNEGTPDEEVEEGIDEESEEMDDDGEQAEDDMTEDEGDDEADDTELEDDSDTDSEEEEEEDDVGTDTNNKPKGKGKKPSPDAKKLLNQSSRSAAKAAKKLAEEAYSRHALESAVSDEDLESEIRDFIDESMYADVDTKVKEYVKTARELEPTARAVFINALRDSYTSNRPPARLPRSKNKRKREPGEGEDLASRVKEYYTRRQKAGLGPWNGLDEKKLLEFAQANPETFEEISA